MPTNISPGLVHRALGGDIAAQRRLVEELTPEIQFNVAKMLRRWRMGSAAGRDLRQEVEDMVQEVFLELFEHDGKVLRRWDPQRLALEGYVGYVARIRTAEVLRSRRSPWREEPQDTGELDGCTAAETPEKLAQVGDELNKVYLCLLNRFRPADCHLFDLLFVRELSAKEAAEEAGKSLDAVYQWRSRLYERARQCRELVSN